jgi:hypothetical protein
MPRSQTWRALGACALVGLLATPGPGGVGAARAADEAGAGALEGADLEPMGSLGSTVIDLIGSFSGSDEPQPKITRVRVRTDRERRADLEVFVTDAAGGRAWARVLDASGEPVPGVESEPVGIGEHGVALQIALELAASVPADFVVESAAVDVHVARAGKRVTGAADVVRRYAFPKRWQAYVPPNRVLLRVRPEPIGAAAQLGVRRRGAETAVGTYPTDGMVPLHERPGGVVERGTARAIERAQRAMAEAKQRQQAEALRLQKQAAKERAKQKARSEAKRRQRERAKQQARDRAKEKARDQARRSQEEREKAEAERERREELEAAEAELEQLQEELDTQKQLGAVGPSGTSAIDPLEGLLLDPTVSLEAERILDVWPLVWLDANRTSGLAYFAPRRFALGWSPESQYSFQVVYGLALEDEDAGKVRISTRLRSRVGSAEIQLLERLVQAYARRHAQRDFEFRELARLPIQGRDITLAGALESQFSISPEVVTVTTDSDLLGAIDLSWATDEATLLDIQSLLRADAGIHGSMLVRTSGETSFEVPVPVEIAVATPDVLGRIAWDRQRGWRNLTLYPVRMRYLHALVIDERHEPILYSWDLGNVQVDSTASVDWDASGVPAFLDDEALRMWIDYSVVADCETCDDLVFDDRFIPALPTSQALTFTSTNAFAATGAFRIVVHVRSRHFDGRSEQLRSVEMRADDEPYSGGTLYLDEGELATADETNPLYEYRLELITEDGEIHESADWIPGWRVEQFIGRSTLREALGFVPGAEDAP